MKKKIKTITFIIWFIVSIIGTITVGIWSLVNPNTMFHIGNIYINENSLKILTTFNIIFPILVIISDEEIREMNLW